jgi:hypothetical protein
MELIKIVSKYSLRTLTILGLGISLGIVMAGTFFYWLIKF